MSHIRILSEHLANQIAAGEVVERPASVIKELVENAIDADASLIDIVVEGNGTRLLRVVDNGQGMDADDVLLCLERHATSKLKSENDLAALATLGFRGEALPSIASVSKIMILSRPRHQELGTQVEMRYSSLAGVQDQGCVPGTLIEVRQLFGNVPARKKFLKSPRTERAHIEESIKNQALAHPHIGFSLQIDQREIFRYSEKQSHEERVRAVCSSDGTLLALKQETEHIAINGFLLLPQASSPRSSRLRLFVNNRPIQDKTIRDAISEGLRGFLLKGYQPAGVVFVQLDPSLVDVNVHPAKREVRFRKGEEVGAAVHQAVSQALHEYQSVARQELFAPVPSSKSEDLPELPDSVGLQDDPDHSFSLPLPPQAREKKKTYDRLFSNRVEPGKGDGGAFDTSQPPQPDFPLPQDLVSQGSGGNLGRTSRKNSQATEERQEKEEKQEEVSAETKELLQEEESLYEGLSNLIIIGQLFSLYLLCQKEDQFVVIDQHAAHERILYGRLRQEYLAKNIPRQQLLFPVSVELSPEQCEVLEQHLDEVKKLGLGLEPFGDMTWVIKEVPALIADLEPAGLLEEVLQHVQGQPTSQVVPKEVDNLLASLACKAAIRSGHTLQPREMLSLLEQMQEADVFSHCPHGRPVFKTWTMRDVERWFFRTG